MFYVYLKGLSKQKVVLQWAEFTWKYETKWKDLKREKINISNF